MKQPNNAEIYNTALYMRLSRDDENYGDTVSALKPNEPSCVSMPPNTA